MSNMSRRWKAGFVIMGVVIVLILILTFFDSEIDGMFPNGSRVLILVTCGLILLMGFLFTNIQVKISWIKFSWPKRSPQEGESPAAEKKSQLLRPPLTTRGILYLVLIGLAILVVLLDDWVASLLCLIGFLALTMFFGLLLVVSHLGNKRLQGEWRRTIIPTVQRTLESLSVRIPIFYDPESVDWQEAQVVQVDLEAWRVTILEKGGYYSVSVMVWTADQALRLMGFTFGSDDPLVAVLVVCTTQGEWTVAFQRQIDGDWLTIYRPVKR